METTLTYKQNLKPSQPIQSSLIRKSRRPTPLGIAKETPEKPLPLKINPQKLQKHNAQSFTLEAAFSAHAVRSRLQLIDTAMRATKLKADGAIVFLGVPGFIEDLGVAAENVAGQMNRYVDAYDSFADLHKSILGDRIALSPHKLTPPTVHGRVRLHDGWPDFKDEKRQMLFCCLARGKWKPLVTLRRELLQDTTLVGDHKVLRALAKFRKLKYMVIANFDEWVAVRASTG